ncbi:PAS domain-containing protein [Thalassospira sp. HJ]|uniref:PAS domain-containing protein n=1 Tax=Thalassospira sp. HJ TaxID=1616823 RepID=UPI000695B6D4|nr:PAS domain S-box protein [Thalassospira sp. HJ]
MFGKSSGSKDAQQIFDALSKSMAVIEFEPDGTIITANDNFLKTMGYELSEIVGQHHRMFMPDELFDQTEYEKFWADLRAGQFAFGAMARQKKNGEMIWLEASYNPILDRNGKVKRVFKFATDITERRVERAMWQSVFRATDQISEEIAGIQGISNEVVDALQGISSSIETARDSVTNIASAVEEQTSVTDGVSQNMQSMAVAVEVLSTSLGEISSMSGLVGDSVGRTRSAAEILAR